MNIEEALREVGGYGKYQKLMLWFVLLPAHLPFGVHYYSQIFMSLTPSHWCRGEEHFGEVLSRTNSTFRSLTMWSRGHEDPQNPSVSICDSGKFTTGFNSSPSLCSQMEYDKSEFYEEDSIVTKWDLVCDTSWLPSLALSIFYSGAFLGEVFHHIVTNRCGRRGSFFLFLALQCLFGVITAFTDDFHYFMSLRFLVGVTAHAVISTPSILVQEIVSCKHRHSAYLMSFTARSLGILFLACMVYLVRDWSHIALVTTLPFLAFFLYWCWSGFFQSLLDG